MPNTFFGLTIGWTGLTASNAAINTVAHNVSNINTKGYTKQSVKQEAAFAIKVYMPYGAVGTGVAVKDIVQSRNEYYDERYRFNNTLKGQYTSLNAYSELIEDYMDEFNLDGFISEYNNLFKAIDGISSEPSSNVKRQQFVSYMSSICAYFNTLATNLQNTQSDVNAEIKSCANTINTIAEQVASLNKQINTIEATGGYANDLRDARNLLIDELSTYVNVNVIEHNLGNGVTDYSVLVGDHKLVDSYFCSQLVCVARDDRQMRNASDAKGLYDLKWSDTQSEFNPYQETIKGNLKALFDMRDGCNGAYERVVEKDGKKALEIVEDTYHNTTYKGIPYYQAKLNNFITTFAKDFNDIILKGETADGVKNTEPLLVSRLESDYLTAQMVTVNDVFLKDLSKLPVSYDASKGIENPDLTRDLFLLKDQKRIMSGTYWDYLTSIVSEIGIDNSRTVTFSKNYSNICETIDNQRQSVSGVDEDEEGLDLVKFQHAYSLASKVISTMNQVYQKLIEETGL